MKAAKSTPGSCGVRGCGLGLQGWWLGVLGCMDAVGWGLVSGLCGWGLGVHDGGLRVCSSWWRSSGSHHEPVSFSPLALHCSLGPSVAHPLDDPPCTSWDSVRSGVFCCVPLPLGAHVCLESSVSCHGLAYTPVLCVDWG